MLTHPTDQPLFIVSGSQPTATVLFIHGLGTDGAQYSSLAQQLTQGVPDPIRFIFPTAPQRTVTICRGQRLTAWFDLLDTDFTALEDVAGLRSAEAYINSLIEAEIKRGIEPDRIIVAGFSQGAALSLLTGLRSSYRLGGIAAMSGWLPIARELDVERSNAARDTPVFIGHGVGDHITPLSMAETTRDWLEARGSKVTWHTYSVGHSIVQDEILDLGHWLRDCLNSMPTTLA